MSCPPTESPLRAQSSFGGEIQLPPHFHSVWNSASVHMCVCVVSNASVRLWCLGYEE